MVKCGVLFEVRTVFLNIIWTSVGFKGLNSVNQMIFVMVKCGVLFEVRTEFLNIIWTNFGFKGFYSLFYVLTFNCTAPEKYCVFSFRVEAKVA
jgi:hypothetical protein